jgi:hypothetical protein
VLIPTCPGHDNGESVMLDRDMSILIPVPANDDEARMEHDFRELGGVETPLVETKGRALLHLIAGTKRPSSG